LLSTTRGSGRGEVKVGAALDAVESGRGGGTFYRASEGAEQMEWRRSLVVSAPSRRRFFEGEMGEEEWTRRRVSVGKTEKVSLCIDYASSEHGGGRRRRMGWRRFGRVGGGGSGIRGKKTMPEVGWAGVAGWAECHLGQRREKTKKNRDGLQG
jgi:hypothetical protein